MMNFILVLSIIVLLNLEPLVAMLAEDEHSIGDIHHTVWLPVSDLPYDEIMYGI